MHRKEMDILPESKKKKKKLVKDVILDTDSEGYSD
jgi:hypothetical protein